MSESKATEVTHGAIVPKTKKRLTSRSWATGPILSAFSYITCTCFLIAVYVGSVATGLGILSFLGQSLPIFTVAAPIAMLLGSLVYWTWRPYGTGEQKMVAIAFNMAIFAFLTWLFVAVIDPYVIHPAANPLLQGQSGGHG